VVGDGTFKRVLVSSYRLSIQIISLSALVCQTFYIGVLEGVANPYLGKGRAYKAVADPGFARDKPW